MKIKAFLTVCIGAVVILALSSILILTQLRGVQSINLDPLADSLYREDSKVLSWILSTIPIEKIDTLRLPESWAEIFAVNNSDLQLTASTNQAHRGIPLYHHPQLLDQASAIVNAIKSKKPYIVNTKEYMVVIQPLTSEQSIIALKPKAWEKGLVSDQNRRLKNATSGILLDLVIFLIVGVGIAIFTAYMITGSVLAPTQNALDAFEALSLGDFNHEIQEAKGKEMDAFIESYLRLKTSLEMALERISRR